MEFYSLKRQMVCLELLWYNISMNIIVHGSDTSRVRKKIRNLKKKYDITTPTVYYDASKVDQREILLEIDSVSIFDERKMVVVENCNFLSDTDPKEYDVQAFIDRCNQDDMCVVIFCLYKDKLNKKKKLIKELVSKVEVIPCIALDEKSKATYVDDVMKRIGLSMDNEAKDYFLRVTGLDSERLELELEKLRTYKEHINLESAKLLVSIEPEDNVFKMTKALFDRNALLFLSCYRDFRKNDMQPVAINALLATQVRFLFKVRCLMDRGYNKDRIASELKVSPGRIYYASKQAQAFTSEELLDTLEQLANLDQNMKTGKMDMDQGFEQFAFNILKAEI